MSSIHIPRRWQIPESQATPEGVFLDRRQLVKNLGLGALASVLGCGGLYPGTAPAAMTRPALGRSYRNRFPALRNEAYSLGGRVLTAEETAASFNNFYEFTANKGRVWELAKGYPVNPWTVEVTGLVKKPRTLDLDDLFSILPLEERLYRFRCVERWAMQIPWTGYPLGDLLAKLEPLSTARYVRFVSVLDKPRMRGQRALAHYPWPYFEGLRLDEATNPLAFVVLGAYGHALPMQHGAPLRIACPWKYGYKSPKSIVRIELTAEQPDTFWNTLQASEYGFYSNVNPQKPHPRWSQAIEEDIETLEKRPTELYNGYKEEVSSLYDGSEY